MEKHQKGYLLRISQFLCFTGGGIFFLTVIMSLTTAIYEWMFPPTDMYLLGLLTTAMMFYAAPIGVILLILGCMIRVGHALNNRHK